MAKVTYEIDTTFMKDMTIGEVLKEAQKIVKAKGNAERAGMTKQRGIAIIYVYDLIKHDIFDNRGLAIKVGDYHWMRRTASDDFIQIHRLNHICYKYVQDFADQLDDKKMLTFTSKRFWQKIEGVFQKYQQAHKVHIDRGAWAAVQDYTLLVYNVVYPFFEPLENAVRDYLIQHRSEILMSGQKDDISMLTKCYVALMFFAGMRNTRINFFINQMQNHGFDISNDFRYANLDLMCNHFIGMMESFGLKFTLDKDGDKVPVGVDISNSIRANSEWNKIVSVLTNEELMDAKALEAINLNPMVKADYEKLIAADEQKEMDAAIEELKQMSNVKAL